MKLFVIFSILSIGFCQMLGGKTDQKLSDEKTKAEYLSMTLGALGLEEGTNEDVKLINVQTQVVAGINTYIKLSINGRPCEIDIYDRVWDKIHQVTRNTCVIHKRQMPGGYSPVKDKTDAVVQKALTMVVDEVNKRSNSMFRMTEDQVVSIEQQVVSGMNYKITVICKQSTCTNDQAHQHLMANRCPVDANSALRPVSVTAVVWYQPWLNHMEVTSFSIKDHEADVDVAGKNGIKPQTVDKVKAMKAVDKVKAVNTNDHVVHGKGFDSKPDTQGAQKTMLGKDDHDYQRHGYGNWRGSGMMGGNGMGPGMMNGNGMGPGMMNGYYDKMGPDMMKDYKMGPDMMKDYYDKMGPDIMNDYKMGPDMMKDYFNKMGPDMMNDYKMGPDMMKDYFNKMGPDMMNDYKMGPDMMTDYLKDNLPKGKTLIGGDTHDYQKHGQPQLGGDDHDYQPHGDTGNTDCSQEMFLDFQRKYNKNYRAGKETTKRYNIFCDNMRRASKLQQTEKGTARYGVTKFADLTEKEFKQYVGKPWLQVKNLNTEMKRADIPKGPIPETFDWRDHGAVTAVKNQGSCGSCWAFSTTGNIEGQWAIKKQKLISLSEQELVDCDKLDEGCNGGLPSNAYKEIERLGGLETETEYQYKGEDEKCQFIKSDVKAYINSSVSVSSNETEMASWLAANGPISIGINAFAMQFYMGGISHPWKIFCNPKDLDHGVLIVGYGVQGSKPYWIVKNSWGEDWGEKGYYLVYRGAGVCGLNTMCTSAVVN